jgi:hypothetical protein
MGQDTARQNESPPKTEHQNKTDGNNAGQKTRKPPLAQGLSVKNGN